MPTFLLFVVEKHSVKLHTAVSLKLEYGGDASSLHVYLFWGRLLVPLGVLLLLVLLLAAQCVVGTKAVLSPSVIFQEQCDVLKTVTQQTQLRVTHDKSTGSIRCSRTVSSQQLLPETNSLSADMHKPGWLSRAGYSKLLTINQHTQCTQGSFCAQRLSAAHARTRTWGVRIRMRMCAIRSRCNGIAKHTLCAVMNPSRARATPVIILPRRLAQAAAGQPASHAGRQQCAGSHASPHTGHP